MVCVSEEWKRFSASWAGTNILIIYQYVKVQLSENRSMWTNITEKLLYQGPWKVTPITKISRKTVNWISPFPLFHSNHSITKSLRFKNRKLHGNFTLDKIEIKDSNNTKLLTPIVNCIAGCFEFKTSSNEIGFIISAFKRSHQEIVSSFSYFVSTLNRLSISWYNFIPT